MNFDELQAEMKAIMEDVKSALDLPLDENGNLKGGVDLKLEDLEKLLEKTQGVVDKLNQRANEIAQEKGMSREEMARYVENPENFSKEEWNALQTMQNQVEQFQKMVMKTVVSHQDEQQVEHEREKAKKQSPGSLKRNWIPL